jgi:hypothetical protein
MPDPVSLCIPIDNVRGLIQAMAIIITSDSTIFKSFDPLGRAEDSIT